MQGLNIPFRKETRQVLALAKQVAESVTHGGAQPAHILMGIFSLGTGNAAQALTSKGTSSQDVSMAFEKIFCGSYGYRVPGSYGLAREGLEALGEAAQVARQLGHNYLAPEHLLLGILAAGDDFALRLLAYLGIDTATLRKDCLIMLGSNIDDSRIVGKLQRDPLHVPFSRDTRKILSTAGELAVKLGHGGVSPLHILLAIFDTEDPAVASQVLRSTMAVNDNEVVLGLQAILGGSYYYSVPGPYGMNPAGLGVLIHAGEEAKELGHDFLGSEHLLLGILRQQDNVATEFLGYFGVSPDNIRVEILSKMIGRVDVSGSGNKDSVANGDAEADDTFHNDYYDSKGKDKFGDNETKNYQEAGQMQVNHADGSNTFDAMFMVQMQENKLKSNEQMEAAYFVQNCGLTAENNQDVWQKQIDHVGGMKSDTIDAMLTVQPQAINPKNYEPKEVPYFLQKCGVNLSKLAAQGKLDPVIGRDAQIKRMTEILGRRRKSNPCLVGEAGVGKTAIVEGLALSIASGDVPENLKQKVVFSVDMGLLLAGTMYRGQFEERLQTLLTETINAGFIILFIDELHTLIGAGRTEDTAIDAANILKPAISRGELQCIGATTLDEYSKYIEADPALERRFQPIQVPEATVDQAIQILMGLKQRYEIHHKVQYSNEALSAAVELSHQYIPDRFLPDKAIDLVDEVGSRVALRHAQNVPLNVKKLEARLWELIKEKNTAVQLEDYEKAILLRDQQKQIQGKIALQLKNPHGSNTGIAIVTEADIKEIVCSWTGIPVENVSRDESARLLHMEETLHNRLIGQDEAVKAISGAIRRARMGLKNPKRPIASFLFVGSTGVGKTELAKVLAAYYFGSEEAMVRMDMSEYMDEKQALHRLVGNPASGGGLLTEAVRRRPSTVVLFDELEKAHPDVLNVMLQILDDGRLTDIQGKVADFKNCMLIMTSNVGSSCCCFVDETTSAAATSSAYNLIKSLVNEELKKSFKPEFLNRLDEIVVFRQLTKSEVGQIADLLLKEVCDRVKKDIRVQITRRFRDQVVEEGYDPSSGARPLRRAITRLLEDCLADNMLAGKIKEGDSIVIDLDDQGKTKILIPPMNKSKVMTQ